MEEARERGRNSICLKTYSVVVHHMLQMNLFEVCSANGFPPASLILCVLRVTCSQMMPPLNMTLTMMR